MSLADLLYRLMVLSAAVQLKKSKIVRKTKKARENQPLTRSERLAVVQSEKEIKEGKYRDFANPDELFRAIKDSNN